MTDALKERPPRIDGYESLTPLARGGMGIVYRARQSALERWVALKVLPHELLDTPRARERFRDEAHRLARIGHPNIVPIHTFGESEGRPYFTMAYVEGETLQQVLRAAAIGDESRFGSWFRAVDPDDGGRAQLAACIVCRALADALEHLHGVGVVHRDVKPANVLIDPVGRPMLVDLGISHEPAAPDDDDDPPPGTLRYMAPELLGPRWNDIDGRADVYALGLTLFEMLTLTPAFGHEEIGALVDAIRRGERPSLREFDRRIPAALAEIVEKATATLAADRFATAGAMGDALKGATAALADEAGISHLALGSELEAARLVVVNRDLEERRRRARRWSPVAVAGLFVLGLGVAGVPVPPADPPNAVNSVRPLAAESTSEDAAELLQTLDSGAARTPPKPPVPKPR